MARISTYGAHTYHVSKLLNLQTRMHEGELKIGSGKVSPDYAGIGSRSYTLVSYENQITRSQSFIKSNDTTDVKLKTMTTAVDSLDTVMREFAKRLNEFASGNTKDQGQIEDIQDYAFRAMHEMQDYLASTVGGNYLFSGTALDTRPVQMEYQTLSQFQADFDGQLISYPTQRQGNMANQTSAVGTTGPLSFDAATGNLVASNVNTLGGFPVGSIINIDGSASNDGRFQVISNDGTNLNIAQTLTTEGTALAPINTATFTNSTDDDTTVPMYFTNPDTITTTDVGGLDTLNEGDVFTISGTTNNDGTYTVDSRTGDAVTIRRMPFTAETTLTDETATVGATVTYDGTTYVTTDLTFDDATSTITPNVADGAAFTGLAVGSSITVASSTGNNGTYIVTGNTGTVLTVARDITISTETTYYHGAIGKQQAQIDANRSVELGVTAADPAFEKAWRAMAIIAQGAFGTPGGLENNQDRIGDAKYLIDSARQHDPSKTPPYGTEQVSDLRSVQQSVGLDRSLITTVSRAHTTVISVLKTGVGDIENIDRTEAVVQLLDDQRALESSYQVLAKVSELSLVNYLK
jgi:flagellar hook-associated protein 3 FlgL